MARMLVKGVAYALSFYFNALDTLNVPSKIYSVVLGLAPGS